MQIGRNPNIAPPETALVFPLFRGERKALIIPKCSRNCLFIYFSNVTRDSFGRDGYASQSQHFSLCFIFNCYVDYVSIVY